MKGEAKVLGLLTMLFAVGLFVACGGGGGGGTTPPTDQGGQPDAKVTDDAGGHQELINPDEGGGTVDKGTDPGVQPDQAPDVCVPQCEGKQCGPDGCGGTCGTCTGTDVCNEETGQCVPCEPKCDGKECGPDGCGGECGTCPSDKPVCTKEGKCVEQCSSLPETWGPAGVFTKLETPAEKTYVEEHCPDFSGDGKGDSALRSYASMINPEIQKALQGGNVGVLFEFAGLTTDFVGPADFDLNGLAGEPDPNTQGGYLLDPKSYDPATCKPVITFPATLEQGSFQAGPSEFILDLAALGVEEVPLTLIIKDATIKGDIESGGPDGVTVKNGILAGVLTKELLDQALAIADQQCQQNPQSWCSYISTAKQLLPMLFDLDLDPNIPGKDAMSVCFSFELGPAKITGYKSEEQPQ